MLIGAFLPYVTAGESRSLSVNLWDVLSSSDVAGGGLRGAVLAFHDLTRDLSLLDDSGFAGSGHWVDVAGIGSYLVALGSVLAVAGGIFAATSQPATR
ncbi:hypothetical protein [Nakamurella aerolata]|uniref:Uncharacterized protein n=1 Tax=Nakamurella aerolata TaxID=1656892 RepID=A0A849A6P4_9ACTN|nr:hypothetical protein [Nakamurella aerolata]NNG34691.1 hypothetical protein [Nakamurella aerolata]